MAQSEDPPSFRKMELRRDKDERCAKPFRSFSEGWRRGWDSNPQAQKWVPVFKTGALPIRRTPPSYFWLILLISSLLH